jgi:uncharacterized protein (DUF2384 family)
MKSAARKPKARGMGRPGSMPAPLLREQHDQLRICLREPQPSYGVFWQVLPKERCRIVEEGLRLSVVTHLAERMAVTQLELTEWLGISAEFFGHLVRGERSLPPTPSERILGLLRLVGQIETAVQEESGDQKSFNAPRWMAAWLVQPTSALGGRRPAEFVAMADGREMLSDLLCHVPAERSHD